MIYETSTKTNGAKGGEGEALPILRREIHHTLFAEESGSYPVGTPGVFCVQGAGAYCANTAGSLR